MNANNACQAQKYSTKKQMESVLFKQKTSSPIPMMTMMIMML